MVQYTMVRAAGASFRSIRLINGHVALRWHVGSEDPPAGAGAVPLDAQAALVASNEPRAGIVAVFNGGFKASAHAGGSMVDGLRLAPLVRGDATIALNQYGQWEIGVWGAQGFPTAGFHPLALRQNLTPLVRDGRVVLSARLGDWRQWGDPLGEHPNVARSGMGVDALGNLVYVATIDGVSPGALGAALVAAGVVTGMELDINPYWPVVGASFRPLHAVGPMPVQIPYSAHHPTMYFAGWTRDYFSAVAEPGVATCQWQSPGLSQAQRQAGAPVAQPLQLRGRGCPH